MQTDNVLLIAALSYAARGWHVFPCRAGLKTPATPRGWYDATTDTDRITAWWQADANYNIGIACGPSNLYVVDIDPAGFIAWAEIIDALPDLPDQLLTAYRVQTPRGGSHYYFTGIGPTSASRLAVGLDTRGQGGYVIAPPSQVSDDKSQGDYVLLCDGEVIAPPIGLWLPFSGVAEPVVKLEIPARYVDTQETLTRAEAWLTSAVDTGRIAVEGSGGDDCTYQTACALLEMGLSRDTVFDLMLRLWNPWCDPPWQPVDLQVKIANAAKHGQDTHGAKMELPLDVQHEHFLAKADETPEHYRRFDPLWLSDVRRDLKPLRWLLPALFPQTGTGLIYGPTGTFKSFIALDLAMSIATGHGPNWWQGGDIAPRPVVFLAGESPYAFKTQRVDSWLHRHLVPGLEARNQLLFLEDIPPFEMSDIWRFIVERVQQRVTAQGFTAPALLVIDTLTRAMAGWDENSARDAAKGAFRLERLARELGCFVIAVHHTGKDIERGMRGSGAWSANADTVIEVERENDKSLNVLLHIRKQKEAARAAEPLRFVGGVYGDALAFERDYDAKFLDIGEERARLHGAGTEEWSQPPALMAVLAKGPMTTEHLGASLANKFGVSAATVGRTLRRLEKGRFAAWQLTPGIWSTPGAKTDTDKEGVF